jgi:hypothetical protein
MKKRHEMALARQATISATGKLVDLPTLLDLDQIGIKVTNRTQLKSGLPSPAVPAVFHGTKAFCLLSGSGRAPR